MRKKNLSSKVFHTLLAMSCVYLGGTFALPTAEAAENAADNTVGQLITNGGSLNGGDIFNFTSESTINSAALRFYGENLDIPTHENLWVLGILRNIEKWALKKADAIVFASRFFADLYPDFDKPQFVLENKPLSVSSICELKYGGLKKPFTVSFIGAVRYGDILVNLMEAIRGDNEIQLYIHGEGADLNRLMTFSMGSSNIHFTGRYEVDQLPKLYMTSDIVWAAYPNKDFNVKYAISNKYHESIQYCVPCIYAEHTRLGDFVKEHNLGYVVNPYSVEDIRECIDYIKNTPEQLYRTRECLKRYIDKEKTWKEQFLPFYQYLISMMKKES